jgi:SOS response associated peptidase (SRAP)
MLSSRDEFYREYGAAMAAWAFVERELSTLFAGFTQMPPALATSIFYSVNSFDARAAIFRNKLAHDMMVDRDALPQFRAPAEGISDRKGTERGRRLLGAPLLPQANPAYIWFMCGRVRLSSDYSEIKIRLKFAPDAPAPNFEPDWNKPPTADMLVAIRSVDGKRAPKLMKWGLIPRWAKKGQDQVFDP